MANIKLGPIVADIRGKVGDVIFSRNTGGAYAKSVTSKQWQTSTAREAVIDAIGIVSRAWRDQLTPLQRQNWRNYGTRHPMPNAWGFATLFNGYYWYTRCNFPFAREHGYIYYPDPPPAGPFPPPIVTATANVLSQYILIRPTLPNYLPWPGTINLLVYAGQSVPGSVNYYQAPWRWQRSCLITNYDTPAFYCIPWEFPIIAGNYTRLKIVAQVYATGEISSPSRMAVLS